MQIPNHISILAFSLSVFPGAVISDLPFTLLKGEVKPLSIILQFKEKNSRISRGGLSLRIGKGTLEIFAFLLNNLPLPTKS